MAKYADDNGLTHLSGLIITWVKGLLSSTNPLMDGTATPGTAKMLAREDHVHPTDTSRQETLVSGTNIKTIGSQSLLGSGNLTMANIGAAAASHTHGNITSGGDITATAPTIASGDCLVINDDSASKVTNGPAFDGSTTSKALSQKGTWESFAAGTHAHGNITSGGDITATAPTIASGDKIIINDESASKVTNGPSFGTDTTKYLRNDGTWDTPPGTANQNAFSNVKVGSTTIAADTTTDTLEVVAGSNVTLTPDATNDKLTIAATDTTYNDFAGSTHGLVPAPASGDTGNKLLKSSGSWQTIVEIIADELSEDGFLIFSEDSIDTDASGRLMTAAEGTKLSGIATGAEVNQNAFSNVKVGSTTIAADGKTDTLELAAGSNVALTPDATNDKVTIAATDSHVQQHGEAGTNGNFQILFTGTPNQTSQAIDSVGFDSVKDFMYNPSTGNLTVTKINTYTLGAACEKSIGAVADNNSGLVTGDAVYDAIQSALGTMADALVYQGTIGAAEDSPTVTSLPATHSKGDVYIVKTAGTYAGKGCEVGDMIICNTDGTTANNAHWDVIQSNIEALTSSEITTIWNNAVTANW